MRITKKKLLYIIRENLDTPDGQLTDPLGAYVFPGERVDLITGAEEENTDIENALFNAIRRHLTSGNFKMPNIAIKTISDMIDNNQYPQIFKKYTSGKAYRGLLLTYDNFERLFGIPVPGQTSFFDDPIGYAYGRIATLDRKDRLTSPEYFDVSFVYDPRTDSRYQEGAEIYGSSGRSYMRQSSTSLASSWSKDFNDALTLPEATANARNLTPQEKSRHIITVLQADANAGYFIDMAPWADKFRYIQQGTFLTPIENELIGRDNIPVEKIYIYPLD